MPNEQKILSILPVVATLRKAEGKIVQDCHVYIGNAWSRDGWDFVTSKWSQDRWRDNCQDLDELSGQVLGCWCSNLETCHGTLIIRAFQEKFPDCQTNPELWKTQYFPDGKPNLKIKKSRAKKQKRASTPLVFGDLEPPLEKKRKTNQVFRNQTTHPEGLRHSGAFHPWPMLESSHEPGTTIYIDETGMGCFAGPLYIGGVILLPGFNVLGLHDSKLLKDHERELAYKSLTTSDKLIYHVEKMTNDEVDHLKLGVAWQKGVRQTIAILCQKAREQNLVITRVVLDGNKMVNETEVPVTPVIKADRTITGVSAASILAKVSRDQFMMNVAPNYPQFYDIFFKGKGYRYSKLHDELIAQGIYTDLHRKSYKPMQRMFEARAKLAIHVPEAQKEITVLSGPLLELN